MNRIKFKNLSPEDLQYITHIYYESGLAHEEKLEKLTKKYGVSGRTIRRWWKEELHLTATFNNLPPQLKKAQERQINKKTDILLVTAAQNKTGINTHFLENLIAYKDFLISKGFKTEIIVAPSRYRNPTSPVEADKQKSDEWWRDEVQEFLHYGKREFGDTMIATESRVRPTAKNPLTGFEVMAKDKHLIVPHSKIHFTTLPRFKNKPLRTMSTTGFCTNKNYSSSKAGDIAFEHHSYGFIVVEKKKDGICHIPRNVKVTSEGSFIDLIFEAKEGKVQEIDYSEGFVWGDLHTRVINTEILEKTIKLCSHLNPKKQVLHDVYDGSAVNPHEVKDMFIQRQKIIKGQHLIEEEVQESLDMIKYISDSVGAETFITVSNHDIFLDRMINDNNWKRDLHNSPAYLKYAQIQQTVDLTQYGGVYGYLVDKELGESVSYLNYGASLDICGYECAAHGDFGMNGAKGSYKSFARLNSKMIHGHQHSPASFNGVSVVGVTCHLDQYYNRRGLSSWAYAHSVIHPNCKNQLLVFGDDLQISSLLKL
jgi:hypothetical protein